MSEFKDFNLKTSHLDEYAWQMRDRNYFRCNEIACNLERIQSENQKLLECVSYYANRETWTYSFVRFQDTIPHNDCDAKSSDDRPAIMQTVYGGKRARALLEEIENERTNR